jgi:hypothetical protein
MKKIWNIVTKPSVILYALIVFQVSQLIGHFLTTDTPLHDQFFLMRAGSAVLVTVIAIAALMNRRPALWITGIYLFTFVIGIIMGLFKVPLKHYWAKTLMIVLGSYFTFGGWIMIQRARGKTQELPNQAL